MSLSDSNLDVMRGGPDTGYIININAQTSQIRYELGMLERHQLRIIPELKFFIDDSLDYIENIDNLLKK